MEADNQYTRIPDEQVVEKTGKASEAWFAVLDDLEGRTRPGAEIVARLVNDHGLSKYWARTTYIRYQWARGLRTE